MGRRMLLVNSASSLYRKPSGSPRCRSCKMALPMVYRAWGARMSSWSASARYSPVASCARRWCWPQCPYFRSFCIRSVDSFADIPLRSAPRPRGRRPTHRQGRAARWARSAPQRNPETPAGTFPGCYTAESISKWWAGRSLPPFCLPSLRAGLLAPFWRAGSVHACQSSGASQSPRRA